MLQWNWCCILLLAASIAVHRLLASSWIRKNRTSPLGKVASLPSMLSMRYFMLWGAITSTIVPTGMNTSTSTGTTFFQVSFSNPINLSLTTKCLFPLVWHQEIYVLTSLLILIGATLNNLGSGIIFRVIYRFYIQVFLGTLPVEVKICLG